MGVNEGVNEGATTQAEATPLEEADGFAQQLTGALFRDRGAKVELHISRADLETILSVAYTEGRAAAVAARAKAILARCRGWQP